MRAVEIKDLITGLLMIIFLSLAIGKYDALKTYARREGLRALSGKSWKTPNFFPKGFEIDKRIWEGK